MSIFVGAFLGIFYDTFTFARCRRQCSQVQQSRPTRFVRTPTANPLATAVNHSAPSLRPLPRPLSLCLLTFWRLCPNLNREINPVKAHHIALAAQMISCCCCCRRFCCCCCVALVQSAAKKGDGVCVIAACECLSRGDTKKYLHGNSAAQKSNRTELWGSTNARGERESKGVEGNRIKGG